MTPTSPIFIGSQPLTSRNPTLLNSPMNTLLCQRKFSCKPSLCHTHTQGQSQRGTGQWSFWYFLGPQWLYIIIYKDDLVSTLRRICYHPYVVSAYTFILGAYLVIPVCIVFGSIYAPSLFFLISKLRSFASRFFHRIPLSCLTTLMINQFNFLHAPPSSRDINPVGTQSTFVYNTSMAEVRSLIRQEA